jgi:GAF domain-containing protein
MLCLPLWIDDRSLGSLSLYAPCPAAFDDTARRLAELFATHAALAIGDAQRTERLRRAASNRDTIGQAKGILMERHNMTAEEAYELLVDASQRTNRKVIDLAHELATTGRVVIP